jgi:RecB family exonuclease
VAFAGRAATVEELRPLAERVLHLPERSEHYAPAARPALHHLERALFEPGAPVREPNGAVRLLEAGGERAEAELVGAEVLELMRLGMAADDIAVLVRGDEGTAALFAQVLGGYGIPVVHDVRVPFARTRLGAGLLAAARAAGPDGTAADLLRWLRTPGRLPGPAAVDALEARVRRGELHGAAAARAAWAAGPDAPPFDALDALAAALAEGPVALLAALEAEADAIWTAPHRRRAAVLAADEVADARAVAALRGAAGELRALADADAALLGDTADVLETLAAVEVREPSAVAAGGPAAVTGTGVLLAEPLDIRARRFRAVFVCGLQDGELPARPSPEPFLPDEDRRELARHAGLVLPQHEDVLDRERSLFYAVVSRPEDVVFLSWRSSDEEGNPQAASPFLDDVRALFTDALWEQRGTRLLADVTWTPRDAPTPHELRRAYASAEEVADPPPLAAPTAPAALERLAARRTESIRGLEAFASCGVKWFVDQALRPGRVDADPEPMRRGALAHRVLERTLQGLAARRGGSARVVPETLDDALAALHEALDEVLRTVAGSGGARRRALLRGLESDVERALRQEAEHGAGFEPTHLEWSFGGERDELGPLPLGGLGATGRVDRIDVGPGGRAIVRDYKGRTALGAKAWEGKHQLQVPLYLLAARELLGLEPVAGLYQPLAGPKLGARGLVRDGAVPGDYTRTDRADDEAFEAALEAARAAAEAAAAALRAGDIRPCPSACSSRGCRHPAICRAGEPTTEVAA